MLHRDEFDVLITEESKKRRDFYRDEYQRKVVINDNKMDLADFIKESHLNIIFFKPSLKEDLDRSYELLIRTNQLNISGEKYTKNRKYSIQKHNRKNKTIHIF